MKKTLFHPVIVMKHELKIHLPTLHPHCEFFRLKSNLMIPYYSQ